MNQVTGDGGLPQGYSCPACGGPPALVIAGQQAFCGSADCAVVTWDPSLTLGELLARATFHRLDDSGDDGDGGS